MKESQLKYKNESTADADRKAFRFVVEERLYPKQFLERYSLPRIVNLVPEEPVHLTDTDNSVSLLDGELLLYRHYISGKIEARTFRDVTSVSRKDDNKSSMNRITDNNDKDAAVVVIPDTYESWFSVVTERGQIKARLYTNIRGLVASQVTSFLVNSSNVIGYVQNFYRSDGSIQRQYNRVSIKRGQILKLLAVYQDISAHSSRSKRLSWPLLGSKQEVVHYAQCLTETRQLIYIPLTTSGQFYAVSTANNTGDDNVSRIYQIGKLLQVFPLPVRVCVLAPNKSQGSMLLESYRKEEVILACTLDVNNKRRLFFEIDVNSKFLINRVADEYVLFGCTRVRKALKTCRAKSDEWRRGLKIIRHLYPRKTVFNHSNNPNYERSHDESLTKRRYTFVMNDVTTATTDFYDNHNDSNDNDYNDENNSKLPILVKDVGGYRERIKNSDTKLNEEKITKKKHKQKKKSNNKLSLFAKRQPRKTSLGDRKTVKSGSFRYAQSYEVVENDERNRISSEEEKSEEEDEDEDEEVVAKSVGVEDKKKRHFYPTEFDNVGIGRIRLYPTNELLQPITDKVRLTTNRLFSSNVDTTVDNAAKGKIIKTTYDRLPRLAAGRKIKRENTITDELPINANKEKKELPPSRRRITDGQSIKIITDEPPRLITSIEDRPTNRQKITDDESPITDLPGEKNVIRRPLVDQNRDENKLTRYIDPIERLDKLTAGLLRQYSYLKDKYRYRVPTVTDRTITNTGITTITTTTTSAITTNSTISTSGSSSSSSSSSNNHNNNNNNNNNNYNNDNNRCNINNTNNTSNRNADNNVTDNRLNYDDNIRNYSRSKRYFFQRKDHLVTELVDQNNVRSRNDDNCRLVGYSCLNDENWTRNKWESKIRLHKTRIKIQI